MGVWIEGKWYEEPELSAYIKQLKETISDLEDKHWSECRQIAHYENELNQWISVKDRLPDESCECLGVVDGDVMEVGYTPKQRELICVWSTCDADGFRPLPNDAVSHWMPLPELPKE